MTTNRFTPQSAADRFLNAFRRISATITGVEQPTAIAVTLASSLTEAHTVTSSPKSSTPVNLSASGVVSGLPCKLIGFYVNSTSGGTIKLYDNASAASGTVINNTITPAIGSHNLFNGGVTNGVYASIGGTIDVTFYVIPL